MNEVDYAYGYGLMSGVILSLVYFYLYLKSKKKELIDNNG